MIRVGEHAPLRLSYERRGRGEPLLLIHGAGSYRRAWDPVLDHLAVERDVIAVDLPGRGSQRYIQRYTNPPEDVGTVRERSCSDATPRRRDA